MQFNEEEIFAEIGRLYMTQKKLIQAVQEQPQDAPRVPAEEEDAIPGDTPAD